MGSFAAPEHSSFALIDWSDTERAFKCLDHPLFTVRAAPIKHSVSCLGYVIEEKAVRGQLLTDRLKQDHGLDPGPICKQIISSPTVRLPNGTTIRSADYMAAPRRPRKIVILGDTCDPSGIAELAMDADVLVHEATNSNAEKGVALEHYHSTAGMAGQFARSIRARTLILTHFSPRNFHHSEYEECAHIQTLVSQARSAFGSSNVFAASDHWRYDVPLSQ